jgi:Predicted membrane protein (DUF2142)
VTIKRSGARLWLLAFAGFCLLHAGWSFATPLNGPPDELQHVIRAAGVVHGELLPGPGHPRTQEVPASLDRGWCFPTQVTVPASCEREPGGDQTMRPVHTTAALYNPVYYAVTSWPLRFWPTWSGIMLSRLINGALMAALLACAVVAASRWFRNRALLAGVVVATTPMLAHLGGAINPNGVEIAAGLALFTALVALVLERTEEVSRPMVALAGLSASVLVTPRFTGLMWLAVLLGVVLVPSSKARLRQLITSRTVWRWSAVVAVCGIASVAWTLFAGTVSPGTWDHGYSRSDIIRFALLDMWPNVANQLIGVTGWSEVLMPRLVYVVWFMAGGMLLLGALIVGNRVDRWRLLALFFATFAPLLALELLTANSVGWFNQGRYFLPGAVGLPLLSAYILVRRGFTAGDLRSITRLLAFVLLPIQLVCVVYSLDRWSSGLLSLNPFNGSWHPPYGVVLPLVLTSLAIVVQFAVYWRASRSLDAPPPPEPDDTEENVAVPAETVGV